MKNELKQQTNQLFDHTKTSHTFLGFSPFLFSIWMCAYLLNVTNNEWNIIRIKNTINNQWSRTCRWVQQCGCYDAIVGSSFTLYYFFSVRMPCIFHVHRYSTCHLVSVLTLANLHRNPPTQISFNFSRMDARQLLQDLVVADAFDFHVHLEELAHEVKVRRDTRSFLLHEFVGFFQREFI